MPSYVVLVSSLGGIAIFGINGLGPLLGLRYSGPAETLSLSLSPCKPSPHPFLDHRSLELGEHAHHLEQRLARRRRRVDPLLMQEEVDTERHLEPLALADLRGNRQYMTTGNVSENALTVAAGRT
jgi:hypothetical protein